RSFDGRDPATGGVPLGLQRTGKKRPANIPTDYTKFLSSTGLKGARLGVTRQGLNGFDQFVPTPAPVNAAVEAAFSALSAAGATVIDLDAIVDANGNPVFNFSGGPGEFLVLCFDFVKDVASYFQTRVGVPVAGGTLS